MRVSTLRKGMAVITKFVYEIVLINIGTFVIMMTWDLGSRAAVVPTRIDVHESGHRRRAHVRHKPCLPYEVRDGDRVLTLVQGGCFEAI